MTKFQKDLLERVLRTFVQAALAVVVTDLAGVTSVDGAKALLVAAVAAGVSAVVGLLSKNVGDPDSASAIPRD
ncbi:MAG: holin [Actinomycetes bacterium]